MADKKSEASEKLDGMPDGIPELGVAGADLKLVKPVNLIGDVVATIYTVCGRGQKFGRVMRLDHVI